MTIALRLWEQKIKPDVKNKGNGESLSVRGRSHDRSQKNTKGKSKSKSKNGQRIVDCWHCNEEGHLKRVCPKNSQSKKPIRTHNTIQSFGSIGMKGVCFKYRLYFEMILFCIYLKPVTLDFVCLVSLSFRSVK